MIEIELLQALAVTAAIETAVLVLPHFVNGPAYVPLGEALVVVAEAPILSALLDWRFGRALAASLLCNTASFVAGRWVFGFLG